jgi:uncharacterized protein YjbI with pentapeptide repeats
MQRSGQSERLRHPVRWIGAAILLLATIGALSLGAIAGDPWKPISATEPGTWVPRSMERVFRYSPFADLVDADVSQKPTGWTDKKEQIELVTSAQLPGADLRGARAGGAFLIRANLDTARLEGANLSAARLEGAYLVLARLEGANLGAARLEGANLRYAQLEGANLGEARLERADLSGARLDRAELSGAHLSGARLDRAHLSGARLEAADVSGARLEGTNLTEVLCLTQQQIEVATTDANTKLPQILPSACPKRGLLPIDIEERVRREPLR